MTTSSPGDSQSDCPSEDDLVAMVEGVLDADAIATIETHIDTCDDCAAVIAGLGAASTPPKPRQVGRYVLDRKIAAGGMGEVWAAWDPKLRREIAVKLVRPDRTDEGRERERLLREARSLARLTHPNVVAVHDVGEAGGEVFIATELVVGETLASRGGASADWRVLVRLYSQAARGLAAAHAVGVVHRDVKPDHLLVGADGLVRVAMTPEHKGGDAVDAPADQLALCVALGEAIAGRRPPMDLDRDEMIAFVGERRAREPELEALCGLLAKGVALDPRARFADMTALADALDDVITPHAAPRPEPAVRAPAWRTSVWSRGVVIALIAAAAGAAAVWWTG